MTPKNAERINDIEKGLKGYRKIWRVWDDECVVQEIRDADANALAWVKEQLKIMVDDWVISERDMNYIIDRLEAHDGAETSSLAGVKEYAPAQSPLSAGDNAAGHSTRADIVGSKVSIPDAAICKPETLGDTSSSPSDEEAAKMGEDIHNVLKNFDELNLSRRVVLCTKLFPLFMRTRSEARKGYVKLDDVEKIINECYYKELCPYCSTPMKQSHFCVECNERVSVGTSGQGIAVYFYEKLKALAQDKA